MTHKFCRKCGAELADSARFCRQCGAATDPSESIATERISPKETTLVAPQTVPAGSGELETQRLAAPPAEIGPAPAPATQEAAIRKSVPVGRVLVVLAVVVGGPLVWFLSQRGDAVQTQQPTAVQQPATAPQAPPEPETPPADAVSNTEVANELPAQPTQPSPRPQPSPARPVKPPSPSAAPVAPPTTSAQDHLQQGTVHLNARRYAQALEEFRHVRRLAPANQDVFYLMGVAYDKLGQLELALESFRSCTSGNYVNVAKGNVKRLEKKLKP